MTSNQKNISEFDDDTLRLIRVLEDDNTEMINNNSKTDLNISQNTHDTNYKISRKSESVNRTDKAPIKTKASTFKQKQDVAKQQDKIEISSDKTKLGTNEKSNQTKRSTPKRRLTQNDDKQNKIAKKENNEKKVMETIQKNLRYANLKTLPPIMECKRNRQKKIIGDVATVSMTEPLKEYDSVVVLPKVEVKEVVDLTRDDVPIYMPLCFATENEISSDDCYKSDCLWETETSVTNTKKTAVEESQNEAQSKRYKVLALCSEEECANKILSVILSYHRMTEMKLSMENYQNKFRNISPEADEDEFSVLLKSVLTSNNFANHANLLEFRLIDKLSSILVEDFNFTRFLQILCVNFEQQYKIQIDALSVLQYLTKMLNNRKEFCQTGMAIRILQDVNKQIKQESEERLFSYQQLEMLKAQIEVYNNIVVIQKQQIGPDYERMFNEARETQMANEMFALLEHVVKF